MPIDDAYAGSSHGSPMANNTKAQKTWILRIQRQAINLTGGRKAQNIVSKSNFLKDAACAG